MPRPLPGGTAELNVRLDEWLQPDTCRGVTIWLSTTTCDIHTLLQVVTMGNRITSHTSIPNIESQYVGARAIVAQDRDCPSTQQSRSSPHGRVRSESCLTRICLRSRIGPDWVCPQRAVHDGLCQLP
jgi:hypothetical protein